MIVLRDTVTIDVPPAAVWSWLESMPEHALEWHPDHVSARWVRGGTFAPNSEMEITERLHGKIHRLRMRVTEVEPGHWVRYRMLPGLGGRFEVQPAGSGSQFTAALEIGVRLPVVGSFIDAVLRLTIPRRLDAIRRHQAEEGANLKALLEAARRPRVIGRPPPCR
jgi:uncharacterized protein YndB with AHSA1/START domain